MAWTDLIGPGLSISPSRLDTDRFGLRVVRATVGEGVAVGALVAAIDALDADVVIARYDAGSQQLAAAFAATRFAVLPAGALVYWSKAVETIRTVPEDDLVVVPATAFDHEAAAVVVRHVIRDSFHAYGNHYTANPLLNRDAALDGYEDWALRSLHGEPANVLVLTRGGEAVGVATMTAAADHVEILLAGMVSGAQGRGWYGTLLAGCEARAGDLGLPLVVISTQVHNVRVQRAWAKYGFRPFAAVETIHLIHPDALRAAASGERVAVS